MNKTLRLLSNGEIYGFSKITKELVSEGRPPKSPTGTETFLHRGPCIFWLRNLSLSAAFLLILPLTGCRISYLFHAAAGQLRFLYHAVPVEEVLQQDSLSEGERRRLALVSRIKEFGENELGLKKSGNYETINLKNQSPVYTVSASPKDKLSLITWWFPVAGSVPYLGFFDLEAARNQRDRLQATDLDTFLGKAEAYSTLGWFKDPLSLNLIQGSDLNLVETILHEMTHTTLYVKGQGEFNEGLAQLIGKRGALLFFEKTFGPSHPATLEARHSITDELLFSSFLVSLLSELDALYKETQHPYSLKLSEREKVFARHMEKFKGVRDLMRTGRFANFGQPGLNNAYLMSVGLYHRHYVLFETVLAHKGNSIRELLFFFQGLSKEKGNLMDKTREWVSRQATRNNEVSSQIPSERPGSKEMAFQEQML
jgi:predicted aminopeptidase